MATIVFCDDLESVRKVISATMASTPHAVEITADGIEGLEVIRRVKPDLVVTDVVMPRLGGVGLAGAMRADPELRHIPIMFLTASLQPDDVERLAAFGPVARVPKPFSPAALRESIEQVLASASPRNANPSPSALPERRG